MLGKNTVRRTQLATLVGVYQWELWKTRQDLVDCIEPVLLNHVYPRYTVLAGREWMDITNLKARSAKICQMNK